MPQVVTEVKVLPPEVLSFRQNFEATTAFLDEFRNTTLGPKRFKRVAFVDLRPVKYISVPVAIVLAAEFHRWSLVQNMRLRVRNSERWASDVRNLLSDLGVFDLLNLPRVSEERGTEDNLTLTPLVSGTKLDGRKIDGLQTAFNDVLQGFMKNPGVYEGLTEAAENAITHAYPADYKPRHRFAGHRWWGASCLDPQTMRLRFFIFDQGAGIPYTLPASDLYEAIRSLAAKLLGDLLPNDSLMLRAAMEIGRTRTGLEHRGLGLKKMSDVVAGTANAYLRILSGKGEIIFNGDGNLETHNHALEIGGTLIEWCLPATALTDTSEDDDGNS